MSTTPFLAPAIREDEEAVEQTLRPRSLDDFATWCALAEVYGSDWHAWHAGHWGRNSMPPNRRQPCCIRC